MIVFDDFYRALETTPLKADIPRFREAIDRRYTYRLHGDHHKWLQAYQQLPALAAEAVCLDADTITVSRGQALPALEQQQLVKALQQLHPWRKGPYQLFDVVIDSEWRSDWKWHRLAPHISSLRGRTVLDVGCGSGYHCWRMAGAGARLVVGIDPSQKFLFQFLAVKKYLGSQAVFYLPLRSEDLPPELGRFDTVFSMGVLYHRRSPFEHLEELRRALKPGGELVLETLVIEGPRHRVLVPGERYAQMRNVWFIPSAEELLHWLDRAGFSDPRLVDCTRTTTAEQRSTPWMQFHSLQNFLDPADPRRTVEGYPAPCRACFIARRPP